MAAAGWEPAVGRRTHCGAALDLRLDKIPRLLILGHDYLANPKLMALRHFPSLTGHKVHNRTRCAPSDGCRLRRLRDASSAAYGGRVGHGPLQHSRPVPG